MTEALMRFKWDRLFALPLQRDFYSRTTSYFMKDDHDALKSDAYAGLRYGSVSFARGLEIFDNIFVCNGNRHWQYVSHFEGTNLWEFGCGAGSDSHTGGWKQDNVKPEHRFLRVKGGYLYVTVYQENGKPKLRFEHRDVDGNVLHLEHFG